MMFGIVPLDASAISTALSTGVSAIKADVMEYAETVIPVAIGIAGLFIAVKLAMRFFKAIAK